MSFLFSRSAEIQIILDDTIKNTNRKLTNQTYLPNDHTEARTLPLFYDGESISGKVNVNLRESEANLQSKRLRRFLTLKIFS